MLNLYFL